jgi:acyl carrier protein
MKPDGSTTTGEELAVIARLRDVIANFGIDSALLVREVSLEGLAFDSLELVELGVVIEEEYGVELGLDDLTELETLGDAVDAVVSRLAARHSRVGARTHSP